MTDLGHPIAVQQTLEEIERDLAKRQNFYEDAARQWFSAQREIRRLTATALLSSGRDSVTEKKAEGELAAYDVENAAAEAEYEALRAVVKVLEVRATILMSLAKSQGRA